MGLLAGVEKFGEISALGIDTWGVDFGVIDKNGRLISNPLHYRDEKRNSVASEMFEIISEKELFTLSGIFILPIMGVFLLYYLKRENSPEYVNASKLLMIPDLFNYFLTGKICNEYTNATTTGMFNQTKKRWEDKIFNRLGIRVDITAEVVMPGTELGIIKKEVCRELSITPIPVIVPATHDTASAEAGIPVISKQKNWACLSMGTWFVGGMQTKLPVINEEIYNAMYGNEGDVEGKSFLATNITGMWIIQQCRNRWIRDSGKNITWDEIVQAAEKSPSYGTFIDVDDPVFSSENSNMPLVIAEYCKQRGLKVPQGMGEIARCIYESIALKLRLKFERLERFTGKKIELLHLIGGGIKNSLLCQWISDVMNLPVVAGPAETTAAGNLLAQLKGTGEINTIEEGREIVRRSSDLLEYEPQRVEEWEQAYNRFISQY